MLGHRSSEDILLIPLLNSWFTHTHTLTHTHIHTIEHLGLKHNRNTLVFLSLTAGVSLKYPPGLHRPPFLSCVYFLPTHDHLLTSRPLLPVRRDPRAPTCAGTLILHTDGPPDLTLLVP